ncbi:Membrane associated serine protease, rhomboid family [Hathewaya proteolytica DSM 3090]|uniref:Membrane associated serine protease, rhomboid family n=1 Tax=Hathewaya proteolytica DSM 3090 TaxID=1121331 RepID=A0A1M6QB77_9CLOT|nr:rhomboid family intramembrane serine protease [Hathewaya proteolytica]SHK17415.1 Membrane associated serine protease, rhomboid family [Hathewaya proteolytica DSM 3090]
MNILALKSKIKYNSPVILGFTAISFIVYLLGLATKDITTYRVFMLKKTSFVDVMQYTRLVTYIFAHASWQHFMGNFTIILAIGPMIEEKYGSKCIFEMILITTLVTGILNIIFFPSIAVLGASGIAFMFIIIGSFTNTENGKIPVTFIIIVMLFIVPELIRGITGNDNISQFGHIVGGICGSVFGYFKNK